MDFLNDASKGVPLANSFVRATTTSKKISVRIAVAKDEAFNFYYQDSLDLLEELGAELIYFSPIHDDVLPDGVRGIYIGGGFPEIYVDILQTNKPMRKSIRKAAEDGIVIYAECGGMMYLLDELISLNGCSHKLCGVLKGSSRMETQRQGLGYITVKAKSDNILCMKGDSFRAHEFHYSSLLNLTPDTSYAYEVSKKDGTPSKYDGICTDNVLASYAHVHFASNPVLAKNFLHSCTNRI
ncbi:MAG: hypothetical protein ACUZ77_12510 [Candidatus Brocadiales bacterium]